MTDHSKDIPLAHPLVKAHQVSRQYPGVLAVNKVSLEVHPGEVLAIVGENGAGKSTLMKMLAGIEIPDHGHLEVNGRLQRFTTVNQAQACGIALIHQELNLAQNLDVGANIFLGREPRVGGPLGIINKAEINRESRKLLKKVGLDIPVNRPVKELSIGYQQLVEIAKALSINARLLIMDEPTSSLSASESERLFEVIEELRDQGVAIIYISHRLAEVKRLANRVAVLRDGENAGELVDGDITHDAMVKMMVGRDISRFYHRTRHEVGEEVLRVKNLASMAFPGHQIDLSIKAGEIVGMAGLVGAGRTEVLRAIFGADPRISGEIQVNGLPKKIHSPADAIDAGMALVSEDRKAEGLVLEMSIRRNVSLPGLSRFGRGPGILPFINHDKEKIDSEAAVNGMRIRTPHDRQIVQYLSGGNQQKVVIGKWLPLSPKILFLDEPTRGIDIGAKEEIYELMEKLASEGMAILFVSSEMEEVLGLADRILVLHEGRLTGELSGEQMTEENIMQLAVGGTQTEVLNS